ncbi:cytochrome P450 [Podospora didyma]|uniref:Cytochrome P450 n=1 Tax=Podospora didyma TaxID=330526 RepID=A0AAE0N2L2_9PEZI|nr:cytochrome P450 [Podospora didyma]
MPGVLAIACGVLGVLGLCVVWLYHKLYPTPLPGIPYNAESARRITGDIPNMIPLIKATGETSESMFAITTRRLGTPIAQILLPGRNIVMLEDPREIEDILLRRNKEFDKAALSLDLMTPLFPHATVGQYNSPALKAQKRLWADVMGQSFLRKTSAPNIYRSTLELIDLWRLKSSTIYKNQPFSVHKDFESAALDAIWVAMVGEDAGIMAYELQKLDNRVAGKGPESDPPPPAGLFVKEQVDYIGHTIAVNANHPFPKLRQQFETYLPRYREYRRVVTTEIGRVMRQAVSRFQRADADKLAEEGGDLDTCAMDLVLRRQILDAKKAGIANPPDPSKDPRIIDEIFAMLVGGYDSTSTALAWFVKFMEMHPSIQTELRSALRAAFPDRTPQNPPTVNEIIDTDIPFLDAVCEETLRLGGPSAANLRAPVADTEILGCKIPKGTPVYMSFFVHGPTAPVDENTRSATSRAAAEKKGDGLLGPAGRDLDVLNPRRWLVKDPETGKETFNAYAIPYLVFGGGFRGCFGRKLATMQYRIDVMLLIWSFEFLPVPEEYRVMTCYEGLFRVPDKAYVNIKAL